MALLVKFEIFVQKFKKYVASNNINFGPTLQDLKARNILPS